MTDADGTRHALHAGVWKFVSADGGRMLSVVVLVSGCTKFLDMEIDERPANVRLTAVVKTFLEGPRDSEFAVACTEELGQRKVSVELREPLAERELLGECGPGGPSRLACSLL